MYLKPLPGVALPIVSDSLKKQLRTMKTVGVIFGGHLLREGHRGQAGRGDPPPRVAAEINGESVCRKYGGPPLI